MIMAARVRELVEAFLQGRKISRMRQSTQPALYTPALESDTNLSEKNGRDGGGAGAALMRYTQRYSEGVHRRSDKILV